MHAKSSNIAMRELDCFGLNMDYIYTIGLYYKQFVEFMDSTSPPSQRFEGAWGEK